MTTGEIRVERLWLVDFRCFHDVEVAFAPGLTVVEGANGQGKTSLLEAVGWVARGRSFRGVLDQALVRSGASQAIVRADVVEDERRRRFEAELRPGSRNRLRVNGNQVARPRDLADLLRVTVFAPDDLQLVKGGPIERRRYLDDLLASVAPRYDAARSDYERVLRQRNALLRGGLRDPDASSTLDVFDAQLVGAGAELVRGRLRLTERLRGPVARAYADLAGATARIGVRYEAEWAEGPLDESVADTVPTVLASALAGQRRRELERGTTLVGPHRDEWRLEIDDLDARVHASQGEQRSLALALRLAGHEVVTDVVGSAPVLLLDDVFSELDGARAAALVDRLPEGQTLLTTAGVVPRGVEPEHRLRVVEGRIDEEPAAA